MIDFVMVTKKFNFCKMFWHTLLNRCTYDKGYDLKGLKIHFSSILTLKSCRKKKPFALLKMCSVIFDNGSLACFESYILKLVLIWPLKLVSFMAALLLRVCVCVCV